MSKLLYTVQSLVDDVIGQCDEQNRDSVPTSRILQVLNRAQDYAWDTLARKYPEPLVRPVNMQFDGSGSEYPLPDDCFEDRLEKVEILVPSGNGGGGFTAREVTRISYRDVTDYESTTRTNYPYYYCCYGRTIRFIPTPSGAYPARLWYLRDPEQLVLPQGRVTAVLATAGAVQVDSLGPGVVTEVGELGSYVNVINYKTGEIRGTYQVSAIAGNRVQLRATPITPTVLSRTISSSSTLGTAGVIPGDYICDLTGTCVPYFVRPLSNFLVEMSVAEIVRSLGGESATEEQILQKYEKQMERTWVGREQTLRIKKRSRQLGGGLRGGGSSWGNT